MKLSFFVALAGFLVPAGWSETPKTKPLVKKPAAKHGTGPTKAGPHGRTSSRRTTRKRPSGPVTQSHPDPERYAQIQHALADRGYFKGEPNGEWKDDSADALRRFQTDQKLTNDGKINSLSLTALGLGPRHDGSTASTVPVPAAEPPPPPPSSDPDTLPPP